MHTITLSDGGSHTLGDQGLLKIEVYPVGGAATNLRLTVTGDDVAVTAPNNTLAVVNAIPTNATIGVRSVSGDDFGIDQSVRVTVTHAGEAVVEFPVVRVGGVVEKTLGSITHRGSSLILDAFGSSVTTDLPRTVMAVASSLRARIGSSSAIQRVAVVADAGTTFHRSTSPVEIEALSTIAYAITTTLGLDSIDLTVADGPLGQRAPGDLRTILAGVIDDGRTRVGTDNIPRPTAPDVLTVYLTATPVRSMIADGSRSVILVTGPGAPDEVQLYALSADRISATGIVAITPELATAVNQGEPRAFDIGASTIADVLAAPVTEVVR